MKNWEKLDNIEYSKIWDVVYNKLCFRPNEKHNLLTPPLPYKEFDISRFYNKGFSMQLYNDLHKSGVIWFRTITKGARMYALNWQHECYSFTTELPFEKDEFDEWKIPLFPNGDFLFFLTENYNNGIFADGLNFKLLFWGEEILKALEENMPEIFRKTI